MRSHRKVREHFSLKYDIEEPITVQDISDVIDKGDHSFFVLQAIDDLDSKKDQWLIQEKITRKGLGLL